MNKDYLDIMKAIFPDSEHVSVSMSVSFDKSISGGYTWRTYYVHAHKKCGSGKTFIEALNELEKEMTK